MPETTADGVRDNRTNRARNCPECGVNLRGYDINAHALTHWPERIDDTPFTKGARERQALMKKWAEEEE